MKKPGVAARFFRFLVRDRVAADPSSPVQSRPARKAVYRFTGTYFRALVSQMDNELH